MTGLFSSWQYDKNRLHSQKSALGGAGDHPQGWWWGHRRQPILCRYGRQQWSERVGAKSLGLQFPLLHFQPLSPYPCQGIRSFQDLMPPPPGKPGPPPLQGGLGLRPCWYFVRVYIDSPGAGRESVEVRPLKGAGDHCACAMVVGFSYSSHPSRETQPCGRHRNGPSNCADISLHSSLSDMNE